MSETNADGTAAMWTESEANRFIARNIKSFLKAHGFVPVPKNPSRLVRLCAHVLHVVWVRTSGRVMLEHYLCPGWNRRGGSLFDERIVLECGGREYGSLRKRTPQGTLAYDAATLSAAWQNEMQAQLLSQVVQFADAFDGAAFLAMSRHYCADGRTGIRHWSGGICNRSLYRYCAAYALAYQKEYPAARTEFAAANAEMEQMLLQEDDEPWGTDSKILADGKTLLALLSNQASGWEEAVRQTLGTIERDVLRAVWRVEPLDGTHVRAVKEEDYGTAVKGR